MKFMRIYIGIGIFFFISAIGAGLYVWYTVQKLSGQVDAVQEKVVLPEEKIKELDTTVPSPRAEVDVPATATTETPDEPIIFQTSELSEAQQNVLGLFGHESDTFVVTQTMVGCAKDAISETRFTEIINGSAPTPLESLKLLPCFQATDGG